jgi:hypothetical protein
MTHKVTEETQRMVENASAMGLPQEEIAVLLEINPTTLRRRYKKQIHQGRAKSNLQVGTRLFQKCMDGDNTALIWWEKTRSGKREGIDHTLSAPGGGPLTYAPAAPELLRDYYAKIAASATAAPADTAVARPLGQGGPPGDEPEEGEDLSPR